MSREVEALLTLLARKRAFREQRGRCFWCDREMVKRRPKNVWPPKRHHTPKGLCTADHLIPSADGGRNDDSNIVAACLDCNNNRGNMPVSAWIMVVARRVPRAHIATILQRLARFGIELPIGHPAHAAPTIDQPIVRAPEEEAPAP